MMFSKTYPIVYLFENFNGNLEFNICQKHLNIKEFHNKSCIAFDCFNKNVKKYHSFIIDNVVEDLNKEYDVI